MAVEVLQWTEAEPLMGTDFGALVSDLRELEILKEDLDERVKKLRTLIVEQYREQLQASGTVLVLDRLVRWAPATTTRKLDEKKLIQAGVTPDVLAKGWSESPRAGYLEVRKQRTT